MYYFQHLVILRRLAKGLNPEILVTWETVVQYAHMTVAITKGHDLYSESSLYVAAQNCLRRE